MSYLEKVREMRKHLGTLRAGQAEVMKTFAGMQQAVRSPGALDVKTKALIGLAIGVAARCDECIGVHVEEALKAGATREEFMETLGVCVFMGGGPAAMYATHAVAAFEELQKPS